MTLVIGVLPVLLTVGDAADAAFPTTTRIRQEVWSLLKQMRSVPSKLPGNAESVLQALVACWTIPEREVLSTEILLFPVHHHPSIQRHTTMGDFSPFHRLSPGPLH